MTKYYSNGKLLITGEYVVLDGAMALAVPAKYGQSLEIEITGERVIHWSSLDEKGDTWLCANFSIEDENVEIINCSLGKKEDALRLQKILRVAISLNPEVVSGKGFKVLTSRNFPENWGLGTSSTLINNISRWFGIDAYTLLKETFGGSGYDIAAAQNNHPITYQLNRTKRSILTADFNPPFKDEIFFVHLNRKQNSRDSIAHYKEQSAGNLSEAIEKISALTTRFIHCETIGEFELLIEIHETIISRLIKTPKLKTNLFPDFPGAIKSLGGWGGDFAMATGGEEQKEYFRSKGFGTIINFRDMTRN